MSWLLVFLGGFAIGVTVGIGISIPVITAVSILQ